MKNQAIISTTNQYSHEIEHIIPDKKSIKLLSNIKFPPQPLTLIELHKELAKRDINSKTISDIICKDISIAAGVIKTINSPFFGLRNKIDNIQRAVTLLGVPNLVNIVNALSLREAMGDSNLPEIESYFDAANDIALVSAGIAKELDIMEPDIAYTVGLFHDCGIPLLLQKFSNYSEVLQTAYANNEVSLTEYENDKLNTNHAIIGYYVCKSWNMPTDISLAILNHHNIEDVLTSTQHQNLKSMVAILSLAEHICSVYHEETERTNWNNDASIVLDFLDLNTEELEQIQTSMFELMND